MSFARPGPDSRDPSAIAQLAAAERASRRNERSHNHDSRFSARRATDAGHHNGAGGDGDVSVPTQVLAHIHIGRHDAALARGHIRRDVGLRLQPRQFIADGFDGFDRFRGG